MTKIQKKISVLDFFTFLMFTCFIQTLSTEFKVLQ